ncbi:MAG: DUF1127 domain-containing protein [Pseudomonadota bacterium]
MNTHPLNNPLQGALNGMTGTAATVAQRPLKRRAADVVIHVFGVLKTWHERSRQRRELLLLDARALRDIGLDHNAVMAEVDKPFWRA